MQCKSGRVEISALKEEEGCPISICVEQDDSPACQFSFQSEVRRLDLTQDELTELLLAADELKRMLDERQFRSMPLESVMEEMLPQWREGFRRFIRTGEAEEGLKE